MPLIEVEKFSLPFLKDRKLQQSISFEINNKGLVVIIGNNGSGKTSFFKALSGEIAFDGEAQINAPYFYLRQSNQLVFDVPVIDLLCMGAYSQEKGFKTYSQETEQKALFLLRDWGLSYLKGRTFQQLSGGEKQLIWLLQAFMVDVGIYLLDEPAQNLDPANKSLLYKKLEQYGEKFLIVCIAHDIEYLKGIKGSFLNWSKEEVRLHPINNDSLEEELAFLKNNRAFR